MRVLGAGTGNVLSVMHAVGHRNDKMTREDAALTEVQDALLSLVDKRPESLYRVLLREWLYSDEVAALLYKARLDKS